MFLNNKIKIGAINDNFGKPDNMLRFENNGIQAKSSG